MTDHSPYAKSCLDCGAPVVTRFAKRCKRCAAKERLRVKPNTDQLEAARQSRLRPTAEKRARSAAKLAAEQARLERLSARPCRWCGEALGHTGTSAYHDYCAAEAARVRRREYMRIMRSALSEGKVTA